MATLQYIFQQGGILGVLLQVMFGTLLVSAIVEVMARSSTGALPFVPFMLFCQAGVLFSAAYLNCSSIFSGNSGCFSSGQYFYNLYSLLAVTGCFSLFAWGVAIVDRMITKHSERRQSAILTTCFGGTIAVLTGVMLNLFVMCLVVRR